MHWGGWGLVISGRSLVLSWSWHRIWYHPRTSLLCFGPGWACHSRRTETRGVPGWILGGYHSTQIPEWSCRFSIPPSVFGCWEIPLSMTGLCLLFRRTLVWLSVVCVGRCRKLWQRPSIWSRSGSLRRSFGSSHSGIPAAVWYRSTGFGNHVDGNRWSCF